MASPAALTRINGDSVLLSSGALIRVCRPWCTLLQYIKYERSLWFGMEATKAFGVFTTYLIEVPHELSWREDKVPLTATEWATAMEEIASTADFFGAFIVFDNSCSPFAAPDEPMEG